MGNQNLQEQQQTLLRLNFGGSLSVNHIYSNASPREKKKETEIEKEKRGHCQNPVTPLTFLYAELSSSLRKRSRCTIIWHMDTYAKIFLK